jgi:hypothetical protein
VLEFNLLHEIHAQFHHVSIHQVLSAAASIELLLSWMFPDMVVPQATMGFNTKLLSHGHP